MIQRTDEQQACVDWVNNIVKNKTQGTNLVIEAVAGSGKTTTLLDMLQVVPESAKTLVLMFNKSASESFKAKLIDRSEYYRAESVYTFHSYGLKLYRETAYEQGRKIEMVTQDDWSYKKFEKVHQIIRDISAANPSRGKIIWKNMGAIRAMISNAKQLGLVPDKILRRNPGYRFATKETAEIWKTILEKAEPAVPENLFDLKTREGVRKFAEFVKYRDEILTAVAREALIKSCESLEEVNFDDMIYLPFLLSQGIARYDYVLVDETQDMDPIQRQLVKMWVKPEGHAIFCGDSNQAIYEWRGASHDSMDQIRKDFKAENLSLTYNWRCDVEVTKEATPIVPQLKHRPDAGPGEVQIIKDPLDFDEIPVGDLMLSRNNDTLVAAMCKALKAKKPVQYLGQPIFKLVENYFNLFNLSGMKADDALVHLQIEFSSLIEALKDTHHLYEAQTREQESKICQTILTLAPTVSGCLTIAKEFLSPKKQDSIRKDCINFATIHRAKGLEASGVWFLEPDCIPSVFSETDSEKRQELNLAYVGVTRAKERLYYVAGDESYEAFQDWCDLRKAGKAFRYRCRVKHKEAISPAREFLDTAEDEDDERPPVPSSFHDDEEYVAHMGELPPNGSTVECPNGMFDSEPSTLDGHLEILRSKF